jgi:hypothetical protein
VVHAYNLTTQEAEIRRIKVRSQPWKTVCKILFQKTLHKKRVDGVAQGVGPKFKPQHLKKKKKD